MLAGYDLLQVSTGGVSSRGRPYSTVTAHRDGLVPLHLGYLLLRCLLPRFILLPSAFPIFGVTVIVSQQLLRFNCFLTCERPQFQLSFSSSAASLEEEVEVEAAALCGKHAGTFPVPQLCRAALEPGGLCWDLG